MIKAIIFEGGEFVDAENEIEMSEWTPEAIEQEFIKYNGPDWADETTDMFGECTMSMSETINVINPLMAQAVKDPEDGGQIYLVKLSD